MIGKFTPDRTPFMTRLAEVEVIDLDPHTAWFVGFTRYRHAGAFTEAEALLVLTRHLARTTGWEHADTVLDELRVTASSWYFYLDESDPASGPILRNGGHLVRNPFGKPYWKGHVLATRPITIPNDEEARRG